MKNSDLIVVIEDDIDDQQLFKDALAELGIVNPVIFFDRGRAVIDFLKKTDEKIFLILSDVNLPAMDGTEIRRLINEDARLRKKSIPFVFYSTSAAKADVEEAYDLMVQGYFKKPSDFDHICNNLKLIIDYWTVCIHPNKFD